MPRRARQNQARTMRDRKREITRERLYDAALSVFRRDGVAAARIDDIASAAGVSRGTFYFHYPTKDHVLLQLLGESQASISEELNQLPQDAPIEEVLQTMARAMAATWENDPDLLREIGTVALKITALALPDATRQHPVQLALIPRFDAAVRGQEIGTLIPPELLTEFFLVNLFGAALSWCGNQTLPLEFLLTNVVSFFLKAAAP
jgi:AcrR family transcriptional regulator